MAGFIDYYAVLGVPRTASREEIQRAYRKQARLYHPDVSKAKDAEEKFKQLNEAYEVLNDPDKRAKYDQFGAEWKAAEQSGTPPPGYEDLWSRGAGAAESGGFTFSGSGDFSDFFEALFGSGGAGTLFGDGGARGGRAGRGARGARRATSGADAEAHLTLTLEEAANGGRRQLSLSDPGSRRAKTYAVNIPKGVLPGQRIRLSGQGEPGGLGGPPGDLYLRVDIAPHAEFRLEGRDLQTVLPVTPWVAALGGETLLRTLDGTLRVKVPPGSSSGRRIKIRGKGFPDPRGVHGDLYAEIRIVVPEDLTLEERKLFEELAKVSQFTPPTQHQKTETRSGERG